MGIASLVLGIISIVIGVFSAGSLGWLGAVIGIIGIVIGIQGKKIPDQAGMAQGDLSVLLSGRSSASLHILHVLPVWGVWRCSHDSMKNTVEKEWQTLLFFFSNNVKRTEYGIWG